MTLSLSNQDRADSEVIGVLLLISMISVAIAIVAVVILSQPVAEGIPAITPNITYTRVGEELYFNITHLGGDALPERSSVIINSDGPVPASAMYIERPEKQGTLESWEQNTWTVGSSLLVPVGKTPAEPPLVEVAFRGGSGDRLLFMQGTKGSSSPVVTASFTVSPSQGTPGQPLSFTDTSTGSPTTWSWEFGDGTTSLSQNPVHAYSTPGTYTVTLTAANSMGSSRYSRTVLVSVAAGSISGSKYHDLNRNGVWDLGEPVLAGWTITLVRDPSGTRTVIGTSMTNSQGVYFFNELGAGTYQVTETLQPGWNCTNPQSGEYTVTIDPATPAARDLRRDFGNVQKPAPVANFIFSPINPLIGQQVQFTDTSTGSPTTWSWEFGDGTTGSGQNPAHTYATTGTYTVRLTITNGYGSDTTTREVRVTACPSPAASFHADRTSGPVPLTVQFTDTSTGSPTGWSWNFGDGMTSVLQNPSHTFSSPATYSVILTATNSCGSSTSSPVNITANPCPAPVTSFSADRTTGPAPLAVQFTDTSTGSPGSWNWDFGDGTTSTSQNPSHTFQTENTYHVTLTAANSCGSALATQTITVSACPAPDTSFTLDRSSGAVPLTVQFTDTSTGSPVSWNWDFGDGTTSTSQNPSHTYVSKGTFYVTLTAGNPCGTKTSPSRAVTVTCPVPESSFTLDTGSGPAPLAVRFTDTSTGSPGSWSWSFGDGGTSTAQNPVHTYLAAGTYSVTLTAMNTCGSSTSQPRAVTVTCPVPESSFTLDTGSGPAPLAVRFTDTSTGSPGSWSWSFGDGGTSTAQNPVHTYLAAGTYSVTLTATNTCGSSTSQPRTITVSSCPLPAASFTLDRSSGTAPLAVQCTDTSTGSPDSWSWSFGDGGTSTAQNPVHTYLAAGTYSVTLTVTNACGSSTSQPRTVTVSSCPPPAASFTQDISTGPAPLTVRFTDTSTGFPDSWSWSFGDGGTSTAQNPTHTYSSAGTYSVTLTASNSCGNSVATRSVTVTARQGSISGKKYNDRNGNGAWDVNDLALAHWQMTLYSSTSGGTPLQVTTTGPDGTYRFSGVEVPGSYRVVETLQAGWTPSNPASGERSPISLTLSTPDVTGQDFGNSILPECNVISGQVTDSSGRGLAGVTLTVIEDKSNCRDLYFLTTDESGFFRQILPNGHTYMLILDDKAGWTTTSPTTRCTSCKGHQGSCYTEIKFTGTCPYSHNNYFIQVPS